MPERNKNKNNILGLEIWHGIFLGLIFSPGIFFGFVGSPMHFWGGLIFAPIQLSPLLEIGSILPGI